MNDFCKIRGIYYFMIYYFMTLIRHKNHIKKSDIIYKLKLCIDIYNETSFFIIFIFCSFIFFLYPIFIKNEK